MCKLVELLTDIDRRTHYDKHFDHGHVVTKLPLNTQVVHSVFKKIMVVGPRDTITV
jgi:hypothetical protein